MIAIDTAIKLISVRSVTQWASALELRRRKSSAIVSFGTTSPE
jgi:hypothetical protein